MRCTGDQSRRAGTDTGLSLGHMTARRSPPGSSHMAGRCQSPADGSETPETHTHAHIQRVCVSRRTDHTPDRRMENVTVPRIASAITSPHALGREL